MKIADAHLSYCTNIHAGELWADHFDSLKQHFPVIRAALAGDEPMGIGLRLSNLASLDLLDEGRLAEFREWLGENNAYVFTMNGFPFGDFHHSVVKDAVHAPDWISGERVQYTQRLFGLLAELLPEGMDGGISTSPLSYKYWHNTPDDLARARAEATRNILSIADNLYLKKISQGIDLHLDIEPEPDGLLETGREFIDWYENELIPMARFEMPGRLAISEEEAEAAVRDHICLCYDICHFAIGYEPHAEVINELKERNIRVGKIQVSAALRASLSGGSQDRERIAAELRRFDEPTYLHQVVARRSDGGLIRYPDLPLALADIQNPLVDQWRAHFHVPVFIEDTGLLKSTQTDIQKVLGIQAKTPFTTHLEVETYTWEVLPDSLKAPVAESIIRELQWTTGELRGSV